MQLMAKNSRKKGHLSKLFLIIFKMPVFIDYFY